LIALGAPSRPSLFLSATPERSPWVTPDAIRSKGAIVVWPTADTAGTPPAEIKERFPDLVPEVPRAFEREVQGRLPLLRIGWGGRGDAAGGRGGRRGAATGAQERGWGGEQRAPPPPVIHCLNGTLRPRAPCHGTASTRTRSSPR